METRPDQFGNILDSADFYEVQIIYTRIDRDSVNRPSFQSFCFNVDSSRYFYPASTVKLPAVLLSLEKLNTLSLPHLDKYTPMIHDSVYSGQISVRVDSTSENHMPSVAHYSKKILVVSDNDAFNRLYEFLGQRQVNDQLHKKGYKGTRIIHRLERFLTPDENAHTEAVTFFQKHGPVFQQPAGQNTPFVPRQPILKGRGYMKDDSLVNQPFDFSYKNFFPLEEQQRLLRAVLFPESVVEKERFELTEEDRRFVMKYMSQLPTETVYPAYYQDTLYSDAYCKFLLFGGNGNIPASLRIFNKVGDAYGYLIDNAYIVDFENNVEFMLSAVIHVNRDGIYNDSHYDYETIGQPFLRNLGNLIYDHERKRPRKYRPDVSGFKFEYDFTPNQ